MTRLEHSDHIMKAQKGETLLSVEPVSALNINAGGLIEYGVGARFRVKFAAGDSVYCLDDQARSVVLDREKMFALERPAIPAQS